MSSEIFTSCVKQVDRKMIAEGRKIALIVDNCPAHTHVEGLEAVKLLFFPPVFGVQEFHRKVKQMQ